MKKGCPLKRGPVTKLLIKFINFVRFIILIDIFYIALILETKIATLWKKCKTTASLQLG